MKGRAKSAPARERLTAECPLGPPYVHLLLDAQSTECLALGVVNARAQLAATKALALLEPLKEKTQI